MDNKAGQKPANRRRSTRIVLRVPLLVNEAGDSPETKWEPVETILVSEHGGMIRAKQNFKIGSTLDIRVRNKDRFAQARVVWTAAKVTPQGMELGFEIVDQEGFWEIKFPTDV